MLPEPSLRFTLPSLHDDTALDCRIYHPYVLTSAQELPKWNRHVAIVAHPYAPMGGTCDDPIVDVVASTILQAGFIVGTFNFRGAGHSAGRTSWTAKPERADYTSLVGFIAYYIHFLNPSTADEESPHTPTSGGLSPSFRPRANSHYGNENPVFLFSGYSYGSMITTQIPPLEDILPQFVEPEASSAAADIRLRAQHLAERQSHVIAADIRASRIGSPRRSLGMRVGGDEGDQRRSHEVRRPHSPHTEAKVLVGVNELLAKTKKKRSRKNHGHSVSVDESRSVGRPPSHEFNHHLERVPGLPRMRPAYLLISPLQGVISHLASMSFFSNLGGGLFSRGTEETREEASSSHTGHAGKSDDAAEIKLVRNPTLAVYGNKDVFVSASKLRAWAHRLESIKGSQFRGEEIATAGHFWVEEMVLYRLRDKVADFTMELLAKPPSLGAA